MLKTRRKINISLLAIFLLFSCNSGSFEGFQPTVSQYFPGNGIKTYSIVSKNGKNQLFINDNLERIINFREDHLWDNLIVNIPEDFNLNSDESLEKFKIYYNSQGDKISVQKLIDNSEDAFDFFGGMYLLAQNMNYGFEIITAKNFKTKKSDFTIYDVKSNIEDEQRNILGLIYSLGGFQFLDITLLREEPIANVDRYIFTEIINSARVSKENLIPNSNEILSEINIDEE